MNTVNPVNISRQAKHYMESLARGIDPISGAKIPEDSILNQERLSRCFLYVSGILQDAMEQAAASSAPASTWEPLLTSGALKRFDYSEQPLTLRLFVGRLNSLREGTSARSFPPAALTDWLTYEGLLTMQAGADDQKTLYFLSDRGEAVGIFMETGEGGDSSPYRYPVFSKAAQRFLICSLDRVITYYQSNWARRLAAVDPDKSPYSAEPVSMKVFLNNLNGAYGWSSPNSISVQRLSDWLLGEGLLYEKTYPSGQVRRVSTKKAEGIGLIRPMRENGHLSNTALYTEAAQRYIVSHLFDIVSL